MMLILPNSIGEPSDGLELDQDFVIYEDDIQSFIDRVQNFVVNQFNDDFDMVAETPELYPQKMTYWIAHDNLLAYHFLKTKNETLASKIKKAMNDLCIEFGLELNFDNLPKTYKVDILFNESILFPMHTANIYDFKENSTFILKSEISNGTGIFLDWQSYGDLIAYSTLELIRQGDILNANNTFLNQHISMWDGIGITDIARGASDMYETYKISLFLLTGMKLNYFEMEDSILSSVVNILFQRQMTNGGIVTHFRPDGTSPLPTEGVDANVETSIITAMAMENLIDKFNFSLSSHSSTDEVIAEQTNKSTSLQTSFPHIIFYPIILVYLKKKLN